MKKNENEARFGHGVVPFCEKRKCWVLPKGPNQKSIEVKSYGEALEFAKRINDMISMAPSAALRLSKAA
jgi:hypothetical protein